MSTLYSDFVKYAKDNNLIEDDDIIVVACSGGIDSIVLLHLIHKFSKTNPIKVKTAHFNHSLRGEDSDADERFVKEIAEELKIPFFSKKEDVLVFAEKENLSIQEAARILRYRFLVGISEKHKAKIATGHNKDDQIETIFYNFLKGYGLYSLSGIPVQRDNIIRPILFAQREDIEKYVEKNKLLYRLDKSNLQPKYIRNKIRLKLFPLIEKEYVQNFKNNIYDLGAEIEEVKEFIENKVKTAFENSTEKRNKNIVILNVDKFSKYFSLVRKRLIYYILVEVLKVKKRISDKFLSEAEVLILNAKPGRRIEINSSVEIIKNRNAAVFAKSSFYDFCIEFKPGENIEAGFFKIESKKFKEFDLKKTFDDFDEVVDLDKLPSDLVVRNWRYGDYIIPFSKNTPQKVKKIFTDYKISKIDKKRIPLLVSGKEVFWIPGIKISEKIRITEHTHSALGLNYRYDWIIRSI